MWLAFVDRQRWKLEGGRSTGTIHRKFSLRSRLCQDSSANVGANAVDLGDHDVAADFSRRLRSSMEAGSAGT